MRKLLGCGAGLMLGAMAMASGSAYAADALSSSGFDWSGGYVGIHGGYGKGEDNATNGFGGPDVQTEPSGWIAGGQVGFNWQFANFAVVGVEATGAATGMTASGAFVYPGPVNAATVSQELDAYGTFRVRAGAAIGPVMPYVNGGVAFAWATRSTDTCSSGCPAGESKTFTGWTAGGGVEIAFSEHVSIRGEYSYLDFGTQNFSIPGPNGGSSVKLTANAVTGGLNFRW